jgi:hypothetical protein
MAEMTKVRTELEQERSRAEAATAAATEVGVFWWKRGHTRVNLQCLILIGRVAC